MAGPHDKLFKLVFGRSRHAAEHFARFLPPGLVDGLDLTTLEPVAGSFVDESMRARHTDLLFRVRAPGGPVYLYLLHEHQSTVDPTMPLRMLRYMTRVWDQDARRRGAGQAGLPPVVPMVLYQGARRWTAATCFEELVRPSHEARWSELRRLTPHFGLVLVDLGRLSDERAGGATVPGLVRLLFKHVGRVALLGLLHRLAPLLRELFAAPSSDLRSLRDVVNYVYEVGGHVEPRAMLDFFADNVGAEAEAMASSAYQMAVEEGRAEGIEQGLERGRAEGRERGRAEGIEQGRALERRALAEGWLRARHGWVDAQQVEELLRLDDEELAAALSAPTS